MYLRVNWNLKSDDVGTGGKVRDDHARAQQHQTGARILADDQRNWHHVNPRTRGRGGGWTDVHDKPTTIIPRLLHEVKGEGTRKSDEAIVARLGHDERGLNIRSDTRAA
jgi:hypothetical protein